MALGRPEYTWEDLYNPDDYIVYSDYVHRSIRAINLHFKHCQKPENSLSEKLYFTNHKYGSKCAVLLYKEAKLDKLWAMLIHYEHFRGERFAPMLPSLPRRAEWSLLIPDLNLCPPDLAAQIRFMQNEIRIAVRDCADYTVEDVIQLQRRARMLSSTLTKMRSRHTEGSSDEIDIFETSFSEIQEVEENLAAVKADLHEIMQLERYVTHRKQQRLYLITFYLRLRAHLLDGPLPVHYALYQATLQISKSYLDTGMGDYFRSNTIQVELEKCIVVLHTRRMKKQELERNKEQEKPQVLQKESPKPAEPEPVKEKPPQAESEKEKPKASKNKPEEPVASSQKTEQPRVVESEKEKPRAIESEPEKFPATPSSSRQPGSCLSYTTETPTFTGNESRPSTYEMMNLVQFSQPRLQRGVPTLSFRKARDSMREGRNN